MNNELTSEIVKGYGIDAGAAVVGITASKNFDSAPEGLDPEKALKGCRSVIVFGASLPKEILLATSAEYTDDRKRMMSVINGIAKKVAKRIKDYGYEARAVNGFGDNLIDGKKSSLISLKHAAEFAGLGTIGKNQLLINPEYGTRLWLSAVLTDADLCPDEKAQHSVCDDCNICVEACPSNALDDASSLNKKACRETWMKMVDGRWEVVCFVCRSVCPYSFGS